MDDNLLQKGEKFPLQHGSEIFLATEEHAFTFHLRDADKNSSNTTNTSNTQAKRKREELEDKTTKKGQPIGEKKMKMDNKGEKETKGDNDWDSSSALAFPSFGTNTFEFDIDKAATGNLLQFFFLCVPS